MNNFLFIGALSLRLGIFILLFHPPFSVFSASIVQLESDHNPFESGILPHLSTTVPPDLIKPTVSQHRHRHHHHLNNGRRRDELIVQKNVIDNPSDINNNGVSVGQTSQTKDSSLSSYLKIIYERLSKSSSPTQSGIVLQALLPSSLQIEQVQGVTSHFLIDQHHLKLSSARGQESHHFIGAQLILTLSENIRSKIMEPEGTHVQLLCQQNGKLMLQGSLPLQSQFRFYTFDVTDLIAENDVTINFHFKLTGGNSQSLEETDEDQRILFDNFFDSLTRDKPFILFRYQNLPFMKQNLGDRDEDNSQRLKVKRRKRRTVGDLRRNYIRPPVNKTEEEQSRQRDNESQDVQISLSNVSVEENVTGKEMTTTLVDNSQKPASVYSNRQYKVLDKGDLSSTSEGTDNEKNFDLSSSSSTSEGSTLSKSPVISPQIPLRHDLCQKHEWLVRPVDIGWHGVISPTFLDLGYCAGSCPFPLENDRFNFTMHSYLMDRHRLLTHVMNLPKNFPKAKCVPVSYKPIMVIDEDITGLIITMTYIEASVDACGCLS